MPKNWYLIIDKKTDTERGYFRGENGRDAVCTMMEQWNHRHKIRLDDWKIITVALHPANERHKRTIKKSKFC